MSSESGQQQSDLLISGYLDDQLDVQQLQQVQQMLLHDRLRNLGMLAFAVPAESPSARAVSVVPGSKRLLFSRRQLRRFLTAVCVLLIGVSAGFIFWSGLAGTPAAAASAELQRLLQASARQVDRTWQLAVEETVASDLRRRRTLSGRSAQRPPKVSLDGALLCVRSGGQFVLTRTLPDGTQFLTGSDGLCSWAVRPDQSVRVSRNPAHFSRDIPGHEHSMSFVQIDQLLAQLKSNYHIQVLPGVTAAGDAEESLEHSDQLMIAVRRRKVPGPGRVEIRYDALTGDIHQLRFIDMPYGPDRLTLRMTLVSEESLQPSFFSHDSHHPPEWRVEQE
jgi:hypothetical protein